MRLCTESNFVLQQSVNWWFCMLLQLFRFDNESVSTEYVGHNQYGSKKSAISTRTDVSAKLGSENKIEKNSI